MTTSDAGKIVADRDRNADGRAENQRPRDRYGAPLPRGMADELGDREEPDEVCVNLVQALTRAQELFDAQRFFEAHEFLEYVWKSDEVAAEDRDFWKGVTQVAVGLCHTQRGNQTGAVTLLRRAGRYLAPYPAQYHGVDAAELAASARQVADRIDVEGPSPEMEFPSFPMVGS